MNRTAVLGACAAAALAAYLAMGLAFIRASAPTYDEAVHLASGYSYLAAGKYVLNISDHPPLAEMAAALPLLALKPSLPADPSSVEKSRLYDYGAAFLYRNSVPAGRLLDTARAFSLLLWGAPLFLIAWGWARRLGGDAAGTAAVCAAALLPALVSNNALVTTDAAPAALFFAAFFAGWRASQAGARRRAWAALAGAAAGLAMASKYSMFVVPPLLAALLLSGFFSGGREERRELLLLAALALGAALLALLLVFKFDAGLYLAGLREMFSRVDRGGSTFALGFHSVRGVWWYFPLVLAVKTPLAALALAACGLAALRGAPRRDLAWLLLPPALYFAAAMKANLQLGARHILPVMPFLAVLAGLGLAWAARRRAALLALAPLLLLWGAGLARAWPHYLAYFNEAAGGPAGGYRVLVDSNLDWGQDVKALAAWLRARGNPPVIFSYFGAAPPEEYGIRYAPFGVISNLRLAGTGEDVCAMERLLLAVSATNLQSTYYYPDKNVFGWLKSRRPDFSAGHSIFVYDLTGDAAAAGELRRLAEANGLRRAAGCLALRENGKAEGGKGAAGGK